MTAYGLESEEESVVVHGKHFGSELSCRTMKFQRTASSVLTECLTQGDHSIVPAASIDGGGCDQSAGLDARHLCAT
jgi:hypothetical protein